MADVTDVLSYLKTAISGHVYPNGIASPSIYPGYGVKVYKGWPVIGDLTKDMQTGSVVHVSLWPRDDERNTTYNDTGWKGVSPVPPGSVAGAITGNSLTLSGTPIAGQGILLTVNYVFIPYIIAVGDTLNSIATNLGSEFDHVNKVLHPRTIL